jgi:hypothetical protein
MFEKFLRANHADFRQRYEGTFGFFCKDGKETLCKLTSIESDVVHFEDINGLKYHIIADAPGEDVGFKFIPPKTGFHNTSGGVFYIARTAARQFQRGLSHRNSVLYRITRDGFATTKYSFQNVFDIYSSKIDKASAIKQYPDKGAVALSSSLCLSNERLFVYDTVIGSGVLTGNTIVVTLPKQSPWVQEVKDACASCNLVYVGV